MAYRLAKINQPWFEFTTVDTNHPRTIIARPTNTQCFTHKELYQKYLEKEK
jgi:hypothetical protein